MKLELAVVAKEMSFELFYRQDPSSVVETNAGFCWEWVSL